MPYGANRILTVGDLLQQCRRDGRCWPLVSSYCLECVVCGQSQNAILRFREDHQAFSAVGVIYVLLPHALLVKVQGCDGNSNAFYDENVITICYEYIEQLRKTMPAETTPAGVTPVNSVVGPLFDTCLHEFGHALFDMLRIPVFGREEDAADQVSAFIILELHKDEARRLIGGIAYAYKTEAEAVTTPPPMTAFANEHGTPAQRFYNVLCMAYGADKELFGYIVDNGYLPKERAESCEDEYQQVGYAYEKLVEPHVDLRRAKRVFDMSWLHPTRRWRPVKGILF